MKISEFLHKNEPKSTFVKVSFLVIKIITVIMLVKVFGYTAYLVFVGMRMASGMMGF